MATCRTFVCWAVYLLVVLTASVASSYVSPLAESREHGRTRRHLFTHIRQDELQLSHRPTTTQHIQVPNDTVEDYTSHEDSGRNRGKREAIQGSVKKHQTTLNDSNPLVLAHWTGKEKSDVIVFLTYSKSAGAMSHLYVSRNYGASFNAITLPLTPGNISRASHLQPALAAKDWYILADTVNNLIWTSKDDMLAVSLHKLTFQPFLISTHPFNKNVVIIVNQNADGSWELHKSDDFCQTFTVIAPKVNRFYWGSRQSYEVNDTLYVETSTGVLRTDDYFATSNMIGAKGFDLLVQDRHIIFLTHEQNKTYATLMISYRNAKPKASTFPDVTGKGFIAKEYFVAAISEGSVFVCINHYANLTNLYVSKSTGADFSLSLERVFYHNPLTTVGAGWFSRPRSDKFIDWHIIAGFPSVIITTQLQVGASGVVLGKPDISTVMTHNKGGMWDVLPAPSADYQGKPTHCKKATCSLHLDNEFSFTEYGSPKIYSTESAPGLLMANGNLGATSTYGGMNKRLVMSTNNGVNWKLLQTGRYHFTSGDHGGVLVTAPLKDVATNALRYSLDGGNIWTSFIFDTRQMQVHALLTEPGEISSVFTLLGVFTNGSSSAWSIVNIDLKNAFKRTCEATDFFSWRPKSRHDYEDTACPQGRTEYIQLRKPSSICFNGLTFKRPRNTSCLCSRQDYYCAVGYGLTSTGPLACLPVDTKNTLPRLYQSLDCEMGKNLTLSKGYRRVAGAVCQDDATEHYGPVTVPCPHPDGHFGVAGTVTVRIFDSTLQDNSTGRNVTGMTMLTSTLHVRLAASVSTGKQLRMTWYFGDGSSFVSQTDKIVDHDYAKPGTYSIKAVVRTLIGASVGAIGVQTASPLSDDLRIDVATFGSFQGSQNVLTKLLFVARFPSSPNNTGMVAYHWTVSTGLSASSTVATANTSVDVFPHTFEEEGSYTVSVKATGILNSLSASIAFDVTNGKEVGMFLEAASSTAISVGWSSTRASNVVRLTVTPTSGGSAVVHYAPYWANSYTVTGLVSGGVYRVDVTAVLENMEFRALVPTRTIHLPSTEEIKSRVEINPSGTAILHWQDLRQQLNSSGAYLVKATTPFLTASRRINAGSSAAFGGVTPRRNYYLFLSVHPISSRGEVQAAITYVSPYVTALGDFLLPPTNLQAKQINASATLVTWEYEVPEVKEFQVTIRGVDFGLRTETVTSRLAYLTRLSPEQLYTVTVSPLCLAARTSCKPMPHASINIHQKTMNGSLQAVRGIKTWSLSTDAVIVSWIFPKNLVEAVSGFRVFVSEQLSAAEAASFARYTQRCTLSPFDVPKCLVDKLVAGVTYGVKVEVIAANSTIFPWINAVTEPEVFRIPQSLLYPSTVSTGRVTVHPKHEIATAMTTVLWDWAASTRITIAVAGSSEGTLVYSVLPSQQQLDVLLFPSTTYGITVTSETQSHTLNYQTPSVSALPHLGVFWNALSVVENNATATSILREFPVAAANYVTKNLLKEDTATGNKERLAGGTFIGRHYYVIVDSVLDNGIPSGNSFAWDASPINSNSLSSAFREPLVFRNKAYAIRDVGRKQWADMLHEVQKGVLLLTSSQSQNKDIYKHVLLFLSIIFTVVALLLVATLAEFYRARRRSRRVALASAVAYQSRLVRSFPRGVTVTSFTSFDLTANNTSVTLSGHSAPDHEDDDDDDDDVSMLSP